MVQTRLIRSINENICRGMMIVSRFSHIIWYSKNNKETKKLMCFLVVRLVAWFKDGVILQVSWKLGWSDRGNHPRNSRILAIDVITVQPAMSSQHWLNVALCWTPFILQHIPTPLSCEEIVVIFEISIKSRFFLPIENK